MLLILIELAIGLAITIAGFFFFVKLKEIANEGLPSVATVSARLPDGRCWLATGSAIVA